MRIMGKAVGKMLNGYLAERVPEKPMFATIRNNPLNTL